MASSVSRRTKRFTLALVVILMLGGAGAAFAYWTSSGTGTGTAATGSSTAFTIAPGTTTGTISPGGAGMTVPYTVTNPGPGTQQLTSVSVTIVNTDGSTWVPPTGCLAANYTATITTTPAPVIIASGGTATGTATVTLANTGVNQDACQGQTVPLRFNAA